MILAGHYPTKHFTLAEWRAMPIISNDRDRCLMLERGFYRASDGIGKAIVIFCGPSIFGTYIREGERYPNPSFEGDDIEGPPSYVVRPIIRVPMGRLAY